MPEIKRFDNLHACLSRLAHGKKLVEAGLGKLGPGQALCAARQGVGKRKTPWGGAPRGSKRRQKRRFLSIYLNLFITFLIIFASPRTHFFKKNIKFLFLVPQDNVFSFKIR